MSEKTCPKCGAPKNKAKSYSDFACTSYIDGKGTLIEGWTCQRRQRDQLANRVGHLVCAGNRLLALKGCACWLKQKCGACNAAEREWKRVAW